MNGLEIPQKSEGAPAASDVASMQDLRARQEALLVGCVERERGNVLEGCLGKEWFDLMVKQVLIHQLREEITARHAAIRKLRQEIKERRDRRPPAERSTDAASRRSKKQPSPKT